MTVRNRFRAGQSGNPRGRPRGSRNRSTIIRDQLRENDAERLVAALREKALAGDTDAAKFLLSRILPPAKELPERANLELSPELPLSETGKEIILAALRGEITDQRAASLVASLAKVASVREAEELEARLRALEERAGINGDA